MPVTAEGRRCRVGMKAGFRALVWARLVFRSDGRFPFWTEMWSRYARGGDDGAHCFVRARLMLEGVVDAERKAATGDNVHTKAGRGLGKER